MRRLRLECMNFHRFSELSARRAPVTAGICLLVVAALLYAPAVTCYFVDDDFQWIAGGLWFDPSLLYRIDRLGHFYRPATQIYFWLAATLLGPSPVAFHVLNLVFHAGNSVLVFMLGERIGGRRLGALASLFFVVQPRSFEAVSWVSGVAHLLCTAAYVSTVILHARRRDDSSSSQALTVGTFTTALLTNEMGVTLLPMLILWDVCFGSGIARRRLLSRYAPFILILAAYLAIEVIVTSRNYLVTEGHYRIGPHLLQNMMSYISWMWVGRRDVSSLILIAAGLLILIWRGSPRARFAVLWIVITLAPVSLFTWGLSARYTYLPAVGLSLLLGVLFTTLFGWASHLRLRTLAQAVLTILVGAVLMRSALYARQGVEDLCDRGRTFRRYADLVRQSRPDVGDMKVVVVPRRPAEIPERFVQPLVETEFRTRVSRVEETLQSR